MPLGTGLAYLRPAPETSASPPKTAPGVYSSTDWASLALGVLERGLIVIDAKGTVREMNAVAGDILGYASEELLGHPCMLVAPPEIHLRSDRFLAALLAQSPKILNHWVLRHKSGVYLPVHVQFKATVDAQHQPCVLVLFAREDRANPIDLVQRAQGERQASRDALSYSMLQLVINNIPARIAYYDSISLQCIFANEAFAVARGKPVKALIGLHVSALVSAQIWTVVGPKFAQASLGELVCFERQEEAPDGSPRCIEVTLLPHFDRGGVQIGIFAMATDISRHIKAEAALRSSEQRLRQALDKERELGELRTLFVSMVSHELRTPLTAIQGSVELLRHYEARLSTQEKTQTLQDIETAVQRMVAIMENLLILGKLGYGTTASRTRCDVLPLFSRLASDVCKAHERAVPIVLEPPSPPWDNDPLLDETTIEQILGNLLGNACKYSAPGSPVRLCWDRVIRSQGSHLEIRVIDQGIGIPAADLPRLFDTFHRASNVGTVPGTGLGLPIAKRAAESLGGGISVNSELGRGSCMTVWIPWHE